MPDCRLKLKKKLTQRQKYPDTDCRKSGCVECVSATDKTGKKLSFSAGISLILGILLMKQN